MDRSVKELYEQKVPYKEMTETEIQAVIDYEVELKVASQEYADKVAIANSYALNNAMFMQKSYNDMVEASNRMIDMLTRRPSIEKAD